METGQFATLDYDNGTHGYQIKFSDDEWEWLDEFVSTKDARYSFVKILRRSILRKPWFTFSEKDLLVLHAALLLTDGHYTSVAIMSKRIRLAAMRVLRGKRKRK